MAEQGHALVELWRPRDAWLELDAAGRGRLMQDVVARLQMVEGAQLIGGGPTARADHDAGWPLFAVWRAPSAEGIAAIQQAVADSGWYEFWEQVNVAGALLDAEGLVAHQMRL